MSTVDVGEFNEVLDRVRAWPPESKITLARRILELVEPRPPVEPPPRRRPASELIGLLKTDGPPPTDEDVERILEEERLRKYGR